MNDPMMIFDRALLRRRRDRMAGELGAHDFLFREVAERLVDRLDDIGRSFDRALDLGCHDGAFARALGPSDKIAWLAQSDISPAMVARAPAGARLALDEEALPFAANQFDLVVSGLSLHWINDLPGALLQIQRALRPDGLFLASLFGGDTLADLRATLTDAELDVSGGVSPRVSPFIDVRDAGMLLQRAGFGLPVVDAETITVSYPDPLGLMHDIRGMGEANALLSRHRAPLRRAILQRVFEQYAVRHASDDGRITASFQIVTMTGWKPHANQPKPLRPGSAAQRL